MRPLDSASASTATRFVCADTDSTEWASSSLRNVLPCQDEHPVGPEVVLGDLALEVREL